MVEAFSVKQLIYDQSACEHTQASEEGFRKRRRIMTEAVGWISSMILLLTISKQIYKQWQQGSSEGVSKWLFVGQMAASAGFTIYSWLVSNWVFVVTNLLMLLNGLIGFGIVLRHQRHGERNRTHGETPRSFEAKRA